MGHMLGALCSCLMEILGTIAKNDGSGPPNFGVIRIQTLAVVIRLKSVSSGKLAMLAQMPLQFK